MGTHKGYFPKHPLVVRGRVMTGGDGNIYQQHDGHREPGGKPEEPGRAAEVKAGLMFILTLLKKFKDWRKKK